MNTKPTKKDIKNNPKEYSRQGIRCRVLDEDDNLQYMLFVRKTSEPKVFRFALIFKGNNKNILNAYDGVFNGYHLIRLECKGENTRSKNNPMPHWNSKKGSHRKYPIYGSHIHILSNYGKQAAKDVIPIENVEEFNKPQVSKNMFTSFVKCTNIIKETKRSKE